MGNTNFHNHLDMNLLSSYQYFIFTEEDITHVHAYGFVGEEESKIHYKSWYSCRILFERDGTILLDNGNQARDRIKAAFLEFKNEYL